MKRGFLMQGMQCHGCGLAANLTPPTVFTTEKEMMDAASSVHKQSKIVCVDPKFIILYGNVLVSNKLVIQKPSGINVTGNGAPPPDGNGGEVIIPAGRG